MKQEERVFKRLMKSLDVEIHPPAEVKMKIFYELQHELNKTNYSFYENSLIERILKVSIPISILITFCTGISAV